MKKPTKPTMTANTTYGGAGTFSEEYDDPDFAPRPPVKQQSHNPIPSAFTRPTASKQQTHPSRPSNLSGLSSSKSHSQFGSTVHADDVPSSLRPSSSMAFLDSYTPPYAPQNVQREPSPAPPPGRRESFPVCERENGNPFVDFVLAPGTFG